MAFLFTYKDIEGGSDLPDTKVDLEKPNYVNMSKREENWCNYIFDNIFEERNMPINTIHAQLRLFCESIMLSNNRMNINLTYNSIDDDQFKFDFTPSLRSWYFTTTPWMRAKSFDIAGTYKKSNTFHSLVYSYDTWGSRHRAGIKERADFAHNLSLVFQGLYHKKEVDANILESGLIKKLELAYQLEPRATFMEDIQDADINSKLYISFKEKSRNNKVSNLKMCSKLKELAEYQDVLHTAKIGVQYENLLFRDIENVPTIKPEKEEEDIEKPKDDNPFEEPKKVVIKNERAPFLRILNKANIGISSNHIEPAYLKLNERCNVFFTLRNFVFHTILRGGKIFSSSNWMRPNDALYLNELKSSYYPGAKFNKSSSVHMGGEGSTIDRVPPKWMFLMKEKVYYKNMPLIRLFESNPSIYLMPYISGEMGIAQNDSAPRAGLGFGLTFISSMLKMDFYYNLLSKQPHNEKEREWGLRFTIE